MQVRRTANRLWEGLASPGLTLLILVALTLIQITALVLPQIPVPASHSTAYNRWLAEFRPRLGTQTGTLASLGLLTVRSSPMMRVMLGLLGLLVAANLDCLREAWQSRATRSIRTSYALLALGGLLAIGGWMGQMLWGWQEPRAIVWPGSPIELPQYGLSVEQPDGFLGLWQGKAGIYVLSRGKHTGLTVQATRANAPMLLLRSVDQEPEQILRLTLSAQEPEAFFATEEAALIFRLIRIPGAIQVQVYRSPSGELVAETVLDGSEGAHGLIVGNAEVTFTPVMLPYYEIIYNPGAIFEAIGMACLAAGLVIRMKFTRATDPSDSRASATTAEAEAETTSEENQHDAQGLVVAERDAS
jgi:hypothetical protein